MVKKFLFTGGCGFVGRHLVKRLSQDPENQITVVDDLSTGLPIEKWPEHLKCEIHEVIHGDCVQFFNERFEKFDYVFHLAAIVEGRTTIENNPLKVAKDLTIDSQLFNWALKTRPVKIVYFSSSAVYPIKYQTKQFHIPLREDMVSFKQNRIDMPDMSYGWSKLTGEYLSYLAAEKYGLRVAIYRPFSGYGEDQALTYPFPAIMERVANKEIPIEVWGDGMQSRDFVYIEDCIDCILSTYEKIDDADALNIGSGRKTTFLELIKLACEINGVEFSIKPLLNKPVGVFARYCDAEKQKSFGFYPRHSLENGINIVCEYLRSKKLRGKSSRWRPSSER